MTTERNFEEPVYINEPYYDFFKATDEFGFDFEGFEKNSFGDFITETYLTDFIAFRKAHISRNLVQFRFFAHKFKGFSVNKK
jgi:hypothetical protein